RVARVSSTLADKSRHRPSFNIRRPRLGGDAGVAEPLLRYRVLAGESSDSDTLRGVARHRSSNARFPSPNRFVRSRLVQASGLSASATPIKAVARAPNRAARFVR